METVFLDTLATRNAAGVWSVSCDRDLLLATLQQASSQAARLGRGVLASFSQPVEFCNPLRVFIAFRQLAMGESFFWERPREQRALVGVGAAATIEAHGSTRFAKATEQWRALQQDAVIACAPGAMPHDTGGPVFFGGFAFDPLNTHTPLWKGFPDGLLVLPALAFHCNEDGAALTINRIVAAAEDVENLARAIIAAMSRVQAEVERIVPDPQQVMSRGREQLLEQDLLPRAEWQAQVADAVKMIRGGAYEKVVLARGVRVINDAKAFDIDTTLCRLRMNYPGAYVFAIQRGERYFTGATPERLICSQDGQLQTIALAGSAPRGTSEEEDQCLGEELLQSEKNQGEHNIVVATIRDALATLCSKVQVAETPHLLKLKNIQHLETTIVGELLPGRCVLEAIEDLHPTPAVGGFPRLPTLAAIRENEQLDRGWYAGPIGWIGASGNGEFAVALRSALVNGSEATLFAGCGIVADSNPESEYAESCLKLQVMLRGLGGED
ncbi:MAG TPA: isochorismate synthase [Ktedonobacteraceae bacterium]|nr:isochorismate synthase [Ktedonobacteraceae bacterium]